MKKLPGLFLFLLVALLIVFLIKRPMTSLRQSIPPISSPTITSPPRQVVAVEINGNIFEIGWAQVQHPEKLSLAPNFEKKMTAQAFVDANTCQLMINGGFYTTDESPIGLFIHEGKTLEAYSPNTLFNGIFSVTNDNVAHITTTPPTAKNTRLALQSGPLLIRNTIEQTLRIKNDEMARRMVIALAKDQTIFFFVVYDPTSPFQGPYLADLPKVMTVVQKKLSTTFTHALNLDGGSASAFYTPELFLQELTSVGSFFCVQ